MPQEVFSQTPGIAFDPVAGYYVESYVGRSDKHCVKSASGGLATWLLVDLLTKGDIDGVVCVGNDPLSPTRFSYRICKTVEEVRACSGSCYQPVEISDCIRAMLSAEGRYAVVALPCIARGLRHSMKAMPGLANQIKYILGLTCGGLSSRHAVESVINKLCPTYYPENIVFRHKTASSDPRVFRYAMRFDKTGTAACSSRQKPDDLPVSDLYEPEILLWSAGLANAIHGGAFMLDACTCCDDVFAECADATFMDAWLEEYMHVPGGTSLALVRTSALVDHINAAVASGQLSVTLIDISRVLESQSGVIAKKRGRAPYNAAAFRRQGIRVPPVRGVKYSVKSAFRYWMERKYRTAVRRALTLHPSEPQRAAKAGLPWRVPLFLFRLREAWPVLWPKIAFRLKGTL
ncbi:MAG: Coenzyme F420 hydrogenase/dehydrogenase, beta subunit C-terminal domain [Candidatus Brocadiia bacterium]